MKTAIVLVTYNHYDMTKACLERLSLLSREKFLIVVVDNASSDFSVQKIREDFPEVFICALEKNEGFGRANNAGVRFLESGEESFDSICLLNNDTLPEASELSRLQEILEKKNSLDIFSPRIKNRDGSEQVNYYSEISHWEFFKNAFRNENKAAKFLHGAPRKKDAETSEVFWTSAVCWMFRRETWKRVGGFDPRIFMYYEDYDFALRARAEGIRFFLAENISLVHLGGQSAESGLARALQHDSSQEYVFKKHFGPFGIFLSKIFRVTRSSLRLAFSIPTCLTKKGRTYAKRHFILLFHALLKNKSKGFQ